MNAEALIWTEGKTDWQHLKHAFQALGVGTTLAFNEFDSDFGEDQLFKQCAALARVGQSLPTIFIFDRDIEDTVRKVEDPGLGYKAWGNNVYSFAIPVPTHRIDEIAICIEHYYTDDELRTPAASGRRLFLSTEFNPTSGRHLTNSALSMGNKNKLPSERKSPRVRIIDSDVYDEKSHNVALSKAEFAESVLQGSGAFSAFTFQSFRPVIAIIDKILDRAGPQIDLAFADRDSFLANLDHLERPQQFAEIVKAAIRACKLVAMIFVAATVRHYEQRIIDDTTADTKKVRPIRQLLIQSFGDPALVTLQKLARHCYHLVDEHAPSAICSLRALMSANPLLGPIGDLFDDLEKVFPPPADRVRTVNKSQLKKPILDWLLPEFAKYEEQIEQQRTPPSWDVLHDVDTAKWREALSLLLAYFEPLRSQTLRVRTLQRVRNDSDQFDVLVTTHSNGRVATAKAIQTYEDIDDNRLESYELLSSDDESESVLDLFPFVVIRDNKLQYYSRTKARGYEYNVVFGSAGHVEPTKRKFGHAALRTTIAPDLQSLFWAQVTPTVSSLGVKANIPAHGPIVGRKQQIADIMEQIIEIPNQNGLVYGPGGVGKTALLIELSRKLFEDVSSRSVEFENIIWVSAKPNYYDPTLDRVEARQPQFQSLDNVLAAILEFHEFEEANTYKPEEKKWMVLELLPDSRTLLILDNFESIARAGQEEILKFFGVTAKQALRYKPDYFKVLVTSRELIPSGFHQIRLKGLDKRESKLLMQRLYAPYVGSGRPQLSDEQQNALYDATQGIPLIIKHCYGQVYEHSCEIDVVARRLSTAGTNVVDFSFTEVFGLLKKDELQLRIILLLELSGPRLMARQMADILSVDEAKITERLTKLVNFQCANIRNTGGDDKYAINDEVRVLTRRLVLENAALATEIKRLMAGLAMDKRMDYTRAEFDALLDFGDYISQGHHLLAENFMKEELAKSPKSVLLNLHYAKYLKEVKRGTQDAVDRLEAILDASGCHQQVLRLLMDCYIALEIPNFEQAHICARELESVAADDKDIKAELAKFYVAWSTNLKMNLEPDPLKEMVRQQKYKELAGTAIALLKEIDLGTHEWHHLLAQSYYNLWDYDLALRHIVKAIGRLPRDSYLLDPYRRLQHEIEKKQARFFGRHRA